MTAPFTIRGPINRDSFETYVEKVLSPTLRPRDVVIMDNLNSHKGKPVRSMIRKAGAHLFFLPAYSPDMNAIEQVFAKVKTLLRKADARSEEELNDEIAKLLKTIPPTNAQTTSEMQDTRQLESEKTLSTNRCPDSEMPARCRVYPKSSDWNFSRLLEFQFRSCQT